MSAKQAVLDPVGGREPAKGLKNRTPASAGVTVLFFLLWFVSWSSADVIPADRMIDWSQAGVEGGIPHRTNICASLTPANTISDINSAIAACNNGVVSLAAGTYNLAGGIIINRSNVTLRGAGPDQTILNISGLGGSCMMGAAICVEGADTWTGNLAPTSIHNWTSGYAKDNTVLQLDSVAGLSAGMAVMLDQLNDTSDTSDIFVNDVVGVGSTEGNNAPGRMPGQGSPDGSRCQEQFVKINQVDATNQRITVSPAIHMPNWRASQNPQVWWADYTTQMVGIEDLTVNEGAGNNNHDSGGIEFWNAYNGWVKNVKSVWGHRNHVWIAQSSRIEVRDSYFYGSSEAHSQSYGVESFYTSDNLTLNNIFHHVTTPIMTGNNTGSVSAYNYTIDMYYLNYDGVPDWLAPGISASHDAGTGLNLFEGNSTNLVGNDLLHGSGNALPTFFRNQIFGWETYINPATGLPTVKNNSVAVQIAAKNRLANFVGNVLGKSGYHTIYEASQVPPGNPTSGGNSAIYILGYPGAENSLSYMGINYDPKAVTTMLRWGNFDYATNQTHWNTNEVPGGASLSQNLPASLFLTGQPGWWTTPWGTPAWPPIGPDVSGGADPSGHAYKIPAQLCYENNSLGGDGTLNFSANNCYAQSSSVPPGPPTIIGQPQNRTVSIGQSATFGVIAIGVPTPTYQWMENGTALSGATKASYTTSATVLSDSGSQFYCVVSNSSGTVSSLTATLIVVSGPVINSDGFLPFKNMFNPSRGEKISIQFGLIQNSTVNLTIYTRKGDKVKSLMDGDLSPGWQTLDWDGRNESASTVASGTYILHLTINGKHQTKKVVVVK